MRLLSLLLLIVSCATAQQRPAPAKSAPQRPRVDLIQLGTFHRGEAEFPSGGGWIGLTPSRDGFTWNRLRIRTSKVEDPITETTSGLKTATQIELETPQTDEPLFLLRGLPLLATKPVHTCFDTRESGSFFEQNPILLTCEARAFKVAVTNMKRAGSGGPSLLQFTHAGITQTLYRWPQGLDDQHAELVWAGDLDGDGKVDLLVNHSEHYNVSVLALYLSTYAGPGQLVGRVACFRTVGC